MKYQFIKSSTLSSRRSGSGLQAVSIYFLILAVTFFGLVLMLFIFLVSRVIRLIRSLLGISRRPVHGSEAVPGGQDAVIREDSSSAEGRKIVELDCDREGRWR